MAKNPKKLAIVTAIAVVLITGIYGAVSYVRDYKNRVDYLSLTTTKQLIIQAAEATKVDAPVDAKSGDIYFPQAKLYLPSNTLIPSSHYPKLTYSYGTDGTTDNNFSVSSSDAVGEASSKIRSALTLEEVFAAVPKLQACARGISLSYQPIADTSGLNLMHTQQLDNSKSLYMYAETACPELFKTVEILKSLKSY